MRKIIQPLHFAIVLLILLGQAVIVAAQSTINELSLIEENKKLAETSGNTAAATTYGLVVGQLKIAELARNDTANYLPSIDKFVEQVEALNARYKDGLKTNYPEPDSFEEFDLLFGQLDAEILRLQKRQSEVNQIGVHIAERATQIPIEIQALSKEEVNLSSGALATGNVSQDDAAMQLRLATLARIAAQREKLEMERLSSKNRLELARKELRLLDAQMRQLVELKHEYQLRREKFNQNQLARMRDDVNQLLEKAGDNPYLAALAKDSLELISQWQSTEAEWQDVMKRREVLETSLANLVTEKQNFEDELTVSSASAMLGIPLMERFDSLLRIDAVDDDALKDAHLQRLKLNSLSLAAKNRESEQQTEIALQGANLDEQQKRVFEQLLQRYDTIYDATSQAYDGLILELIKYKSLHNDLSNRAQELRRLVKKNSLWIANVSAADMFWFRQIAESVVRFVDSFSTEIPRELSASFSRLVWHHIYPAMALLLLLMRPYLRRRFVTSLHSLSANVGSVKTDRIQETLYVLGASLLLSMLWAAPFYLVGHYCVITDGGAGHLAAFGTMFIAVARFLFVIRFLVFASMPDGFFLGHLRFPETLVRSLLKALRVAQWVGCILIAACILTYGWPDAVVVAGVGRLLFFLLAIFVAAWIWFLIGEMYRVGLYLSMHSRWIHTLRLLLPLLPLISALASLFGYFFLAQMLLVNAYQTLSVLLLVLLAFMVFRRVFAIQERRLAYERALARREEELAKRKKNTEELSTETPVEVEEFEVDTAVLRSRSMSLLQLIAFAVFIAVVMQIWSDFLLAFDWMNDIALWESVKTVGDTQTVDIVSLRDLLVMLIVFVVMTILAINLPSFIDLLILQKLHLEPGVAFAITTVTSYIIVIVGVLAGFAEIGMDWSKMQWLVAALGVGVGFGLQEIVANLVSGLILLFERPIRLGDLITVQGESGTVSRIRMRATTIVDYDRREIVVPNKILLSEKITNWSLTDGITRVVIPVGVSYGSDVELVTRLLLKAAKESSLVQAEPPPEAFFIGFGNSTLDFELRVFAAEIGRRMPTRHDLHRRILALFRANNIDIAYPQMDIHVIDPASSGSDKRDDDQKGFSDSSPDRPDK